MLKSLRKKRKLTQVQLSQKCGLSQNYISELENYPEKNNLTIDAIISLSDALEVDGTEIFKFFVKKKLENKGK